MKTALDPRHLRRREAVQNLFSWSFQKDQPLESDLAKSILQNLKKIDQIISQAAPEWPIEQINKIDLAILRLAVYELVVSASEPEKVIIDEAVELGKAFGSEKSSAFVNGVLGTVFKNISINKDEKPPSSGKENKNSI